MRCAAPLWGGVLFFRNGYKHGVAQTATPHNTKSISAQIDAYLMFIIPYSRKNDRGKHLSFPLASILTVYHLLFNKRINTKLFTAKIASVHINSADALISIVGVIVDALIGIDT